MSGTLAAIAGRRRWLGLDQRGWYLVAWGLTIVLFLANLLDSVQDWGAFGNHLWAHVWTLAWLSFATVRTRTVGVAQVTSFFFIGYFPVVAVTYVLAEPTEILLGTGNFQTAFLVPLVEEVVKAVPLLAWGWLLSRRGVHASVSDLLVLAFAVGAGFGVHEDILQVRNTAVAAFDGTGWGQWFPSFFRPGGAFGVIAHAGWTLLVGTGIGVFLVHRRRPLMWIAAAVPLSVAVLDHMAVNWRGGGWFDGLLTFVVDGGQNAARLVVLSIVVALPHDAYVLWWVDRRDRLFPSQTPIVWLDALLALTRGREGLQQLRRRLAYLRYRNAVHVDLYRLRSVGRPAGDRRAQVRTLAWLGERAGVAFTRPTPTPVATAPPPPGSRP